MREGETDSREEKSSSWPQTSPEKRWQLELRTSKRTCIKCKGASCQEACSATNGNNRRGCANDLSINGLLRVPVISVSSIFPSRSREIASSTSNPACHHKPATKQTTNTHPWRHIIASAAVLYGNSVNLTCLTACRTWACVNSVSAPRNSFTALIARSRLGFASVEYVASMTAKRAQNARRERCEHTTAIRQLYKPQRRPITYVFADFVLLNAFHTHAKSADGSGIYNPTFWKFDHTSAHWRADCVAVSNSDPATSVRLGSLKASG